MADVTSSDIHTEPGSAARSHGNAWRRFAARYYDYLLMVLLVTMGLAQFPAIEAIFHEDVFSQTMLMSAIMLGSVPVFALMIEIWGTTPGKWLFGLTVEQAPDDKLSYEVAIRREWGAFLEGLTCNIVPFISGPMAYYKLFHTGAVDWDRSCGAQIAYGPSSFGRVCFGVLAVFGLAFAYGILVVLGVLQ